MEGVLSKQMDWEKVEAVVYADTKYPFQILGPRVTKTGVQICCFYPKAKEVSVKVKNSKQVYAMEQLDDEGFFGVLVEKDKIFKYTYLITNEDGTVWEQEDAYAFLPVLPDDELELFAQGIHYEIYNLLGAHKKTVDGVDGVEFAVWAPNAEKVSVVGDFNLWDGRRHLMEMQKDSGIFALFILNRNPVSIVLAVVFCLAIYFVEILVDNACSRVKWNTMLWGCWLVTLLTAGINLFVLMLIH